MDPVKDGEFSRVGSLQLSRGASKHFTQPEVSKTTGMASTSEGLILPGMNREGRSSWGKGSISGPNKEKIISKDPEAERGKLLEEN